MKHTILVLLVSLSLSAPVCAYAQSSPLTHVQWIASLDEPVQTATTTPASIPEPVPVAAAVIQAQSTPDTTAQIEELRREIVILRAILSLLLAQRGM